MKMRLHWVAWPVMPDCSGRREQCSWWRRRGLMAGGGRQGCWLQELRRAVYNPAANGSEFQLGLGLGYAVGAILLRDAVFSRVVRTSRLHRHILMDRSG